MNYFHHQPGARGIAFVLLLVLMPISSKLPAQPGGDFTLTDHNGQPFNLQSQRGKTVLLFFGYTSCPDICPAELTKLASILRRAAKENDRLQVLFVSVDPARDSPEVLKKYVQFFHPGMIGLTGSEEEIRQVAQRYRAHIQRQSANTGNGYTVDHSSNLYVIDPQGKLTAVVPYGLPPEHVISLIRKIRPQHSGD